MYFTVLFRSSDGEAISSAIIKLARSNSVTPYDVYMCVLPTIFTICNNEAHFVVLLILYLAKILKLSLPNVYQVLWRGGAIDSALDS